MRLTIGRWFKWFVLLLLLAGGFAYYARHNPHWKDSVRQVLEDFYILPDRPRTATRARVAPSRSTGGGKEKVDQTSRDMDTMSEMSQEATQRK